MADQFKQLGIDLWSIVLYMANTGVVLVILFYFLYKPILKTLDQRRKNIADSIEEANLLRNEFEKKLKKTEQEKEKTEQELRQEMVKMKKMIEEKRTELIEEMEIVRTDMLHKSQEEIDKRKKSLIKEVEQEITQTMTRIILDIVQNKVPETVVKESITDSWKEYKIKN
ncbi:MAG: ATP synthase F0 subunit B, F-type H+-transporting ATPase subunit b [Candidatus Peregrinibacteria bacterium GW2011_GWE2_39_6]|nr:MAG: ATP synthase F0 subunit B, F-type H+-transporting ATPase subunit b [Candidatus Peregrinibacteria bacterium GW2011_GWF2_39_17]KKR26308.1 MAG: ATP synthase F0 subunit B, F-type H+-transporting ATPase subunit b [Candidatus Peregrinibacteria bacterium GW2011_GWE2_39_6]HCW32672.1 hypothetical protein [Candidatus Peregrinibacteria bacterium]